MHDALPLGGAAGGDGVPDRGQPADHGRAGPAGARVGGHPDRLVHHHDVVVGVDHPQAGHRLRAPPSAAAAGAGRVTSSQEPALTLSDFGRGDAVDQRVAGLDQRGRGGPGEPEEPGDGLVQPHAVEPVRHRQGPLVARRAG